MDETIVRLKRVLEVAATVPGNRDRFMQAGLLDNNSSSRVQLSSNWQNAFGKLHPIDKQTVRQSPGLFLANVDDVVYRGTTSGSRGESFVYFAGREWNRARNVARRRTLEWWGIGDNTPIINVASRMQPSRAVDVAIAGKPDKDFIQLLLSLMAERPTVIRGYPSRLCEVATHLIGKKTPKAIAVICTGECLYEYQRSLLEEVFCATVVEEYGCQETGISGMTCPEVRGLHLDGDRCLYEIIDGELVTTDLLNLVMPLVRYKCGDIIDLNADPCPCGRPGLTGKILGRIEDGIRTLDGIKFPGEITMPRLDGILNYQVVRREGKQIDIWLQPEDTNQLSLDPLLAWTDATFGEVEAQIVLDDTLETNTTSERSCDDVFWIQSITEKSWGDWLKEPIFPKGEARKAAQLLNKLIAPAMIGSSLPPTTKALLYDCLDSPPIKDPYVEQMTARVLLFACNFLADDPQVKSIYTQAAQRLQSALALFNHKDDAAVVEKIVPSLFLDTNTASAIWANCPLVVQLDTFNVHNLMYAFEQAWRKAIASGSKTAVALKPILAILIGDLNFFAPRFGTWLLAHWFELIHGSVIQVEAPKDDKFLTAWLAWRRQLIKGGEDRYSTLLALQKAARSPSEQARVYLEKGYGLLVAGEQLDPHEWLKIIDANAGLISNGVNSEDVDPIAWIPILRSLVLPLLETNQPELAYQCLVASAPPSSRTSAFDRLAHQVNDKQSVLCDWEHLTQFRT